MGFLMVALLLISITAIVIATSKYKLHPFVSLLLSSLFLGIGAAALGQLNLMDVDTAIREGFGSILANIGIVIVLGAIIGVFLEKSGAALKMADTVIKKIGPGHPSLAMSIIGWIVSIPVFCDSGFVILNTMRKTITRKTRSHAATMSVALATGLYASHTLVPPTPGPISAAGNLGIGSSLGMVILFGICISLVPMLAGYIWARFMGARVETREDLLNKEFFRNGLDGDQAVEKQYGQLPSAFKSFAPIVAPILLIAIAAVATLLGDHGQPGIITGFLIFSGSPLMALLAGFLFALFLAPSLSEEVLMKWIGSGIRIAGPIILITGAGGAFGAVIKATPLPVYLGQVMENWNIGIFLPFIIAAALKTAQGSTTTTMVATSAIIAPLTGSLGLDSVYGTVLTVMSIGAGAMVCSHANDSYFWVVAEFTGMDIKTGYKTLTAATAVQGGVTMLVVLLFSFLLL